MGVRGFLSYLKKRVPLIDPLEIEPQRVGIDTHGLLYIWQEDMEAIMNFLQAFQAAGHSLVFVFDGEAPAEKKEYLQKRRERREHSGLQAHALEQFLVSQEGAALDPKSRQHLERQIQMLKASTWSITREYREKIIALLQASNQKIIFAKGEADDELVALEKQKQIDVILSSDMDFIRFGVNRIWIPQFKASRFSVYDFDLLIFCGEEDINLENLADVATLCGSEFEYSSLGPSEALGLMRYYGSLKNLIEKRPEFQKYLI